MKARTAPIAWRKAALPLSALLLLALLVLGWVQRETLFPQWFPKVLRGHSDLVYAVAISPDGKTVASGSGDPRYPRGEVRLWDIKTGRLISILKGFRGEVWVLAFSPDGQTLATGTTSPEGGVALWNVQTGQVRRVLVGHPPGWPGINPKSLHTGWIWSLAFSPNGKTLAAQNNSELALWDIATGKPLWKRKSNEAVVVFSPDGKSLVSMAPIKTIKHPASYFRTNDGFNLIPTNGQAQMLNAKTGRLLHDLPFEPKSPAQSAAFSSDGKTLALISVLYDKNVDIVGGTLKTVDLAPNKVRWTQTLHLDGFTAVAFSPDGRTVVTEQAEEKVSFWDAQTGKPLFTFKNHLDEWPSSPYGLAFSKDGRYLASRDGKDVKIWRADLLRR